MYVLITRPEDKAEALARKLDAKGCATLVEPLLTVDLLGPMAPLAERIQAIALTSAHAVPALSKEAKRLPVYTVGKATAKAAADAGCSQVISGDSDAADLAGLIAERCRSENGAILHLSGEVVREDLKRILVSQGFEMRREIVYRARTATTFSTTLRHAWRDRKIAAVLLFSPRTAETLVRLLIDQGFADYVDTVSAICLSEMAATPCRALAWKEISLAARPNEDALIRALEGSIGIC